MSRSVTAFLERQAALFLSGDLETYARSFAFPAPGFLPGAPLVMRRPEDLITPLARLRETALAAGLLHVEARVSAVELPRNGRLRVWWRPVFHYPGGADFGLRDTVYYLSRDRFGGLRIELAECGLGLAEDAA